TDPLVTIAVLKFDEIQRFLTLTRHAYNPQVYLISKSLFDKLSAADRDAIRLAAVEARDYERKISRERNAQALERLRKTMQVTEPTAADQARMRDAVKPVIDKYTKQVGEGLVADARNELGRLRAAKPR